MVADERDRMVESLRNVVGRGLRVVAEYDGEGYDAIYVRDDVRARIAEVGDAVHGELVLHGIGRGYLEDLFDAGALHCSMHRFDEITVFHFVGADLSGVFVSVDSEAELPLAEFAEECKRWV